MLLFGHQSGLLSSRKGLLRTIGCDCLVVSTLLACREAMRSGGFQLIVLCQTVSGDECRAALDCAAESCPATPLLIMFGRHANCRPEREYVLLDATAGPDAFIRTAQSMLTQAAQVVGYTLAHPAEPAGLVT